MDNPRSALFIICRDHGREVLVDRNTGTLPSLLMSGEEQFILQCHAMLATAFAENYTLNICPLFTFENSETQPRAVANDLTLRFIPGSDRRVIVGECFDSNFAGTASLRWSPAGEVKGDASEQQALTRALQLAWDRLLRRSRMPLARFNWFRPLFAELAMGARGFDAAFTTYRGGTERRAAFRITGPGSSVWLKAASIADSTPKNVLRTLAYLGVPHMPAIEGFVSHASDWDAVLQEDVAGVALDRDDRMESWIRAAEGIAQIQLATIGKEAHLSASGCPIWTISRLEEEASRLFRWLDIDIFKQQRFLPAVITFEFCDSLLSQLSSIAELEVPHTLIRNSLSPMEVVTDLNGRPFFVGCEDASVGFPFVWCHLLAEAAHRRFGAHEPVKALIFEAYCSVWRQYLSSSAIESALRHVAFVSAVTEAVRAAQIPSIAVPDRFIQPDKYEWAFRLTRDCERARRVGDSIRKAMTLVTRQSSAA